MDLGQEVQPAQQKLGQPNYRVASCFSDEDECTPAACGEHAQCVSEGDRAMCQCAEGFAGDGKQCTGKREN